jgi:hypothetical protein
MLLAFLLVVLPSPAQNSKLILGTWRFADIYEKEKMKKEDLEFAVDGLKDFEIGFYPNNKITWPFLEYPEMGVGRSNGFGRPCYDTY